MDAWHVAMMVLLALGALALSETLGAGVLARSRSEATRAGWFVTCLVLALALNIAVPDHGSAFRVHLGVVVLASFLVHALHARWPVGPTFWRANVGAVLGAAPWLVCSLARYRGDDVEVYLIGVGCMAVAYLPLRWIGSAFSRFLAAVWPVREEVVGPSLWLFVRPLTVLPAFALVAAGIALVEPRGLLVAVAFVVGLGLLLGLYRLLRWIGDPLREGRIWYRPRPDGGFALIDALAGAAIAIVAITVACEAIVTRQHLAADAALDAAARRALAEAMEETWTRTPSELASEGTVRRALDSLHGGIERTTTAEEPGALWRVRVSVRWKSASGVDRTASLETLRAEAGGRR